MNQDYQDQLEALFRLFREQALDELTLENDQFKARLARRRKAADSHHAADTATSKSSSYARKAVRPTTKGGRTVAVRAPLIGIFYRAATPGDDPFVEIGGFVREGDTVCVVEAMKVFNEIKAEWSGRVVAIPAENGKLVKAGDPLIVLEFLPEENEEVS